jgi:L-aminopeptidase/D-esterase-like protein
MALINQTLTAIESIKVGHATDATARTGCTVVLCPAGATAGVDVRGAAPGTRETEALRPGRLVQKAHAVLLTGGSAFGLDAAGGVVQYLEEQNVGFPAGPVRVPIVPAAVIFDLGVGDPHVRPDREMGYQACLNATDEPVAMGAIGAGTGATVGKAPGITSSPGGVGSACKYLDSGLIVAAIVVVNALGNVVDPRTGEIVAGAKEDSSFVDITERLLDANLIHGTNTTIGVVATNATLTPAEVHRVAEMAHDGMARAIRPSHTMFDGDTLFSLTTGAHTGSSVNTVGILAAEVVAEAIVNAVTA